MAEALAAYSGSALALGAVNTPLRHSWDFALPGNQLKTEARQRFNATLTTQEYTSGHAAPWQTLFYAVLAVVPALSLCCLYYTLRRPGLVTDLTEPQNLFALAINSPPSAQIKGSCGGGPRGRDLVVPWRVAYAPSANHYFFDEAAERPWRGKYAAEGATKARPVVDGASSYKRLSAGRGWL
ncbi:hypothetical protein UVI_02050440 [Ustilaginoidea virens]|nr:hypothetical protein UVI_02050440 [Ustilaginoidea virens]